MLFGLCYHVRDADRFVRTADSLPSKLLLKSSSYVLLRGIERTALMWYLDWSVGGGRERGSSSPSTSYKQAPICALSRACPIARYKRHFSPRSGFSQKLERLCTRKTPSGDHRKRKKLTPIIISKVNTD
ncbi:hypothetical protein J6590_016938 [Homalodisca vitripennis]|nr:hypothetical protein J6590_016938 [Homalodisca vitripennis]